MLLYCNCAKLANFENFKACRFLWTQCIMFLMDLGQFEGSDFIYDVCQLVSVEHFLYGMKSKMAAKKYNFSSKASNPLHLDPMYV